MKTYPAATAGRVTVSPVKKEVLGQPLGSDDLEDDLVGLQGLTVDSAGQSGVEALRQPFAYRQLLRNHLVFGIVLQNLRKDVKKEDTREKGVMILFP